MNLSRKISLKIKLIILAGLAVIAGLVWQRVLAEQTDDWLTVTFFDIGQGDSIFIEGPDGHQILIDGGPSDKVLQKLAQAMGPFDKKIDLVILTHPDADHISGLVEVLKHYQVNQILASPAQVKTGQFDKWQQIISQKQIALKYAQAGQQVKLNPMINLDIVYPFTNQPQEVKEANAWSLVGRLCYWRVCFLLAGDIENGQEKILAQTQFNLQSQILKAGHHGSKTSSSDIFLKKVQPEIVVISVGKDNRFGHPHQEVLDRLRNYTDQIWRTDEVGDIEIKTDGERVFYDE